MYQHQTQIRVRYAETDQMGMVYYGQYATYYEVGRVEMLRSLGLSYRELEAQGIWMPVAELHVKYLRPARYDELLVLETTVRELPAAKMVFDYALRAEQGTLLNTGQAVLFFMDAATQKPRRAPQVLLDLLRPFFVQA